VLPIASIHTYSANIFSAGYANLPYCSTNAGSNEALPVALDSNDIFRDDPLRLLPVDTNEGLKHDTTPIVERNAIAVVDIFILQSLLI